MKAKPGRKIVKVRGRYSGWEGVIVSQSDDLVTVKWPDDRVATYKHTDANCVALLQLTYEESKP